MSDDKQTAVQLMPQQANEQPPKANESPTAKAEKERARRFCRRYEATAPAPRYISKPTGADTITLELKADFDALTDACGTVNPDFAAQLVGEVTRATCHTSAPSELVIANAGLAALSGIAPTDEMEAMLAAQMVATHQAAMKMMGWAMREKNLDHAQWRSGFVVKLLRTFTMQMEAMQRYRGKGQQKMTVEHVHVHAGGQAIVGSVNPAGGVGVIEKTVEQSHAKQIEHRPDAPLPALPCANTAGEAVPVSRDAERTLPNARRASGRTQRQSKRL